MKKNRKYLNKYLTLKALILLVVLLVFNSYAWFVFATRVSGGLTAHVTSWNINFQAGNEQLVTNVEIAVSKIYPGMETYVKEITAKNVGESIANLKYEFQSLVILGDEYTVGKNCTQEELNNRIYTAYPFKITVEISQTQLQTDNQGEGKFTIKVEWPYESGDDEKDTYWGEKAYEFNKNNPDKTSLKLKIFLIAEQQNK